MGAALHLLVAGPAQLYVVAFAIGCALAGDLLPLRALCLDPEMDVAVAVRLCRDRARGPRPVGPGRLRHLRARALRWQKDYIVTIVAVLGTTITPYCFFWQSSEEAEEERIDPAAHALLEAPKEAPREISRIRLDTYVGMGFSNLISWFIIVTTAATLNAHGVTDIQTSAQAAEALRPIAGAFTFVVFAAGIIGIGLLAVPVLAGSAAYALGEALGWPTGLARLPRDAKAFYGTIVVGTLIGVLINFVDLDPIKALFWCAVINGVVAVPLMVMIMIMAMQKRVMGAFTLPRPLWAMGWLCTGAMAVAVVIMFATW